MAQLGHTLAQHTILEPIRSKGFSFPWQLSEDGDNLLLLHNDWCRGVAGVGCRPILRSVSAVEPGIDGVELLCKAGRVWALSLSLVHIIFGVEHVQLGLMLKLPFQLIHCFLSTCINAIF